MTTEMRRIQREVLRAWYGHMAREFQIEDFPEADQQSAQRVAEVMCSTFANQIARARSHELEGMREAGEPSVHQLLYLKGSRAAEAAVRVA